MKFLEVKIMEAEECISFSILTLVKLCQNVSKRDFSVDNKFE